MPVVKIAGTGSYLPARVVSNEEIAPRLNSSSEWIISHTGIESRHMAGPDESAATLGAEAGRRALEAAGAKPEEIGMVILATTSPDYGNYPSTACLVQSALGCVHAAAFDLAAACSGFVYGLEMARCYLMCHPTMKALVIGSEVLTRHVDWANRSNAMLFGDAAGAAVLELADADEPFKSSSVLGADGNGAQMIVHDTGCRRPSCADILAETPAKVDAAYMVMDGHAVFTFAVRKLDEVLRKLCADVGMAPEGLDKIYAHQANLRILDAVARRMKLPMDKFYINLKETGNTSSASIPLCLDRAVREGELKDGQKVALVGFGSGLTWAGLLMKWPYL